MGADAREYLARREEAKQHRPSECPGCMYRELVGHGWYPRFAVYLEVDIAICVYRLKCKGCRKTISLLPDFLHRHRHYALAVIEALLRGRLEQGRPWSQLAPSLRTIKRWVAAWKQQSFAWTAALMQALALAVPDALELDPHGQAPSLFALGAIFVAWFAPGQNTLRVMWRWGWNAGVGRLV